MTASDTRPRRIARVATAGLFLIVGTAHLVVPGVVARIVPPQVPAPVLVVIVTGLCEIAGAIALFVPRWRRAAGWALTAYALCVWPANLWHAMLDLRAGTGLPVWYHVPRLALQPAIIWLTLYAAGIVKRG